MSEHYIRYIVTGYEDGKVEYMLAQEISYYSERYKHKKTVSEGFISDGASGAVDIKGSRSWWVHDAICVHPFWDDGTPITAWQAAQVLSDILKDEGEHINGGRKITRAIRSQSWGIATFLFGCKAARQNGWF